MEDGLKDPESLGEVKDRANGMLSFYCPTSIIVLEKKKCHT